MDHPTAPDLFAQAGQAADELQTMQDFIRWTVSRMNEAGIYFGHGTDNPWDEALLLVTHALHLPWNLADEWRHSRLTRSEREAILDLVVARIEQNFAPWWQGDLHSGKPAPRRILDVCTGSGCIGIACAVQFPQAEVELLDISFEALEVAEENIHRHELQERVTALQSDLFSAA